MTEVEELRRRLSALRWAWRHDPARAARQNGGNNARRRRSGGSLVNLWAMAAADALFVSSQGNVGIGSTSPTQKLDVCRYRALVERRLPVSRRHHPDERQRPDRRRHRFQNLQACPAVMG